MKPLGFVFRTAPHGVTNGREGLDAVLATSAYSEDLHLFFMDDGVFQLVKNQQPALVLSRDYIATFKMLELYDIDNIYVCQDSMNMRGLTKNDFIIDITVLDEIGIKTKLQHCHRVLSF
ncbi:sulfurtransferase complex subunit TusC [Photobacterium frigidiphilum]|uniref:Protein TusC homolog n=1 Tax=Photobacterium frigidiphilum TaxID=264736 RepID=A0A2T3JLK7_9GAMM|nr:sulfurtransferase complex subunit TusC [Photobacterium frigidiphilum]PSU49922.1 sulfurtransferase complex subunit TusC [Photobacterium frigidiphilum]